MWYALRMGFGYEAALMQPVSRILTMMAIEQFKCEGARLAGDEIDVFDPETMEISEVIPDLR